MTTIKLWKNKLDSIYCSLIVLEGWLSVRMPLAHPFYSAALTYLQAMFSL